METYIVAISIYIIAAIVWRFVFGIPFISGYGVGQRKTEGLHTLFMTKEELREFRKLRKGGGEEG